MISKSKRLLSILLALVLSLTMFISMPIAASADGDGTITVKPVTNYTTSAVQPKVEVVFTTKASANEIIYLDRLISGIWVQEATITTLSGTSGTGNIFAGKSSFPAGTYTFRVRLGGNTSYYKATSPQFTVTVKREPTIFGLDKSQYVGSFVSPTYPTNSNPIHYTVKTLRMTIQWPSKSQSNPYVVLQKYDTKKKAWVNVKEVMLAYFGGGREVNFDNAIKQTTTKATKYRYFVAQNEYVTGGTSAAFTVSGKKQTSQLSVSYSSSKQKYKKTQTELLISSSKVLTGKATIYDGTKKLKTVTVRDGYAIYKLPKKLKKGTHKIKVVLKPSGTYKTFYKDRTSKVKRIKVTS